MPARLDFSQGRQYDTTKPLRESLSTVGSMLNQYQDRELKRQELARQAEQDAIRNKMAEERLGLLQSADTRAEDKLTREVTGQEALRDYSNQLSAYGQDVVPDEQGQAIGLAYEANLAKGMTPEQASNIAQQQTNVLSQAYTKSPTARLEQLSTLPMPSGEYDPSQLMVAREKALATPQAEIAAQAKAEAAQNKLIYDRATKLEAARIRAEADPSKAKEVEALVRNNMPRDEAILTVYGDKDGKGSGKGKYSSKTVGNWANKTGEGTAYDYIKGAMSNILPGSGDNRAATNKTIAKYNKIQTKLAIPNEEMDRFVKGTLDESTIAGFGRGDITNDRVVGYFQDVQFYDANGQTIDPAEAVASVLNDKTGKYKITYDSYGNRVFTTSPTEEKSVKNKAVVPKEQLVSNTATTSGAMQDSLINQLRQYQNTPKSNLTPAQEKLLKEFEAYLK